MLRISNRVLELCVDVYVKYFQMVDKYPEFSKVIEVVLNQNQRYYEINDQMVYEPYVRLGLCSRGSGGRRRKIRRISLWEELRLGMKLMRLSIRNSLELLVGQGRKWYRTKNTSFRLSLQIPLFLKLSSSTKALFK